MFDAAGPAYAETGGPILPTGPVTVLVADVDRLPGLASGQFDRALDVTLAAHCGRLAGPRSAGHAVAVFESPIDALAAAMELSVGVERRLAVHTGPARVRNDGDYTGPALQTAERLVEIANVGQTLVSAATARTVTESALIDRGLHRLRDLSPAMRVFELQYPDSSMRDPLPLRSLERVPNTLPIYLTSFVGREAELAAVCALLRAEQARRLVTITGVGGAGKTRLAAQVAADLIEQWPDGVWWVELGSILESAHVADLATAVVGVLVEPIQGPLRSLTVQARDRRMLICLDNCEQVLDGAAELADAVLRACPEVAILTTSREPLGVPGEVVWRLPPLAADDALALFVERASVVRPWFTLDASSDAAVRTMCTRLDGVPLALELAAAWLRTLTPQQIEAGLDDRFALLIRGARGAVPRQQTLAASVDWSHALLDESDQIVFRRLAVFAGGFGLEAARSVAGNLTLGRDAVLVALGRLVDKSLVGAEERAGESRYRLLETIRQYAADRLAAAGELEVTRDRHLDHFLGFAESIEPELQRDMDAWRTQVELEHDNLRTALDWGLAASDPERGRRLAATLPWLWHLHGTGNEGIKFLRRAIGRAPNERSTLQARLLTGVALVADTADPLELEFDAAQRALVIASEQGDDGLRALCLTLSAVGQFYTDFGAAWELSVDAVAAAELAGDPFVPDAARALQGIILHLRDRHAEAEPRLASAIEGLLRRHRGIAATTLGFQASGATYTGELDRARRLAEQAVQVAEPLGDYLRVGSTRSALALVHGLAGDIDAGLEVLRPVLRLVEGTENNVFVPGLARAMGALHLWRGDAAAAATWFQREAGSKTWLAAQSLPGLGAALRTRPPRRGRPRARPGGLRGSPIGHAAGPSRRPRTAGVPGRRRRIRRRSSSCRAGGAGRARLADLLRRQPRRPGRSGCARGADGGGRPRPGRQRRGAHVDRLSAHS